MKNNLVRKVIKKIPPLEHLRYKMNEISNSSKRKKSVAMFHTGRCGSTVLGNMLNDHSNMFWASEIFEKDAAVRNTGDLELAKSKIKQSFHGEASEIFGFETKYLSFQHLGPRCLLVNIDEYIQLLQSMGFEYFILLHRKNYLRKAISLQSAREKEVWFTESKSGNMKPVTINVAKFKNNMSLLEYFETIDKEYEYLKQLLSSHNILSISYEDDIQKDPSEAYNKVCNLLNIRQENPQIKLKRTNPLPCKEVIKNIEEVEELLRGSKYQWMLSE